MQDKLFRIEFIGRDVKVLGKDISGKIIDETKNMLKIMTKKGVKKIFKKNNKFELWFEGKKQLIEGDMLAYRPHERIKLKVK